MEWRSMESAPKCASPIELRIILFDQVEVIVPNVTWKAPIDYDDDGNEFYCYDECGWWHDEFADGDGDEFEADWVVGAATEILGWRPQPPC